MGRKRDDIDWEAVEREYRAGQFTVVEIAKRYGVNASTISRRARNGGWSRDLSHQVRQRTKAKATERAAKGAPRGPYTGTPAKRTPEGDEQIVEEAAERGADVIDIHRRDLSQARQTATSMLAELAEQTQGGGPLREAIEAYIAQENLPLSAAEAVRNAVSLPRRAQTMSSLTRSMWRLVTLERQAYNLDGQREDEGDFESELEAARRRAGLTTGVE